MPVVSVAERLWRRRALYQDTTASLMEDGSIVLCRRFVSKMLMPVVCLVLGAPARIQQLWYPGEIG